MNATAENVTEDGVDFKLDTHRTLAQERAGEKMGVFVGSPKALVFGRILL
jgi:hypothetical protein